MATRSRKKTGKSSDPEQLWQVLELVSETADVLRSGPPEEATFVELLRKISTAVSFDGATLYLIDRDQQRLKRFAGIGRPVELLSFLSLDKGDGLSGWTANNRKPILLSERSSVSSFDPGSDYATFVSVPLLSADDVIGVLNLGCEKPGAISEAEVTLLSIVADQMALALERNDSLVRLEQSQKELAESGDVVPDDRPSLEDIHETAELLALASNEINNALSVIVGNVNCLIQERAASTQKSLARLRRMESAALRIGNMNRKLHRLGVLAAAMEQANGEEARS